MDANVSLSKQNSIKIMKKLDDFKIINVKFNSLTNFIDILSNY